uniref:Uncharacterized protein n=1 Tax=Rhizophora mucronata TaxID=61149 RepID=A0A2P2Q4L6_RHIMU
MYCNKKSFSPTLIHQANRKVLPFSRSPLTYPQKLESKVHMSLSQFPIRRGPTIETGNRYSI